MYLEMIILLIIFIILVYLYGYADGVDNEKSKQNRSNKT
ncbi:hypothetical protein J2S15_000732 [Breznakia pachnodae]|uniref:Uncharacterized protein n=1 Tax=Breznakia pachnodae TaxID=265178 RepID=A0ABU0DZD8_9FIRM|nr:hypothetical protein [Breznakia pachnodae]